MTIEFDIDIAMQTVTTVATTAEQQLKRLLTHDGKPIAEPTVYEARREVALQPLREAHQRVLALAERATAEADTLDSATYADPLAGVDNETLQRMTALAPFVKEEIAETSQISLANRLRGVLAAGDEATQRLYLRYSRVQPDQNGAERVSKLLRELDAKVNGPRQAALAKDTAKAQNLRARALEARMTAGDTLGKVDGTAAANVARRQHAIGVM